MTIPAVPFRPISCHSLLVCLLLGVVLAGCAAPVGVDYVSPRESYNLIVENALGAGKLSTHTKTVLHRYNLLDLQAENPQQAIADLHEISKGDHRRDLLFALAELSYLQGENPQRGSSEDERRRVAQDMFLQTAVYAYFYLLDEGRELPPTAYDRNFRVACDLYNSSLLQAFPISSNGSLIFSSGTRTLPGGALTLTVNTETLSLPYATFAEFFAADSFAVRGFAVRNRNAGMGLPLVGMLRTSTAAPNGGALPLTAFLRLSGTFSDYQQGSAQASLELFSALDTAETQLNGQSVPLETDITAPLAYRLNDAKLWTIGERRFLTGAEISQRVLFIQPYEPGRIPVIFVHGTASSPIWWAEMVNSLRADPTIRNRFQFWFYQYNSSNIIMLSAAELREAIAVMIDQLDPLRQDPALQNMVVVGHSQGGLLSKMTAVDPDDTLWQAISDENLDVMTIDAEKREFLRRLLLFEPLPSVKRVVFISTPHRGSFLTKGWVRDLVRKVIRAPVTLLESGEIFASEGPRFKLPASIPAKFPPALMACPRKIPCSTAWPHYPWNQGWPATRSSR
jgi:pimeloyl-ACP methyl ester carboxylesterase